MQAQSQEQETKREKAIVVCPRCGAFVSWFETHRRGDREYVYAVHYLGYSKGRKAVRKCYLGPAESYDYVSRLHYRIGLELYGFTNPNRVFEYLDVLLEALPEAVEKLNNKEADKVIDRLIQKMRKAIEILEKARQNS